MDNDVYYRIMFWDKIERLTVVTMQWFDEHDYNENKFLRDEDNNVMRWNNEVEAIQFLNENFKPEYIDIDYVTPNNKEFIKEDSQFKRMRHT
jgi:hypothetical protein